MTIKSRLYPLARGQWTCIQMDQNMDNPRVLAQILTTPVAYMNTTTYDTLFWMPTMWLIRFGSHTANSGVHYIYIHESLLRA